MNILDAAWWNSAPEKEKSNKHKLGVSFCLDERTILLWSNVRGHGLDPKFEAVRELSHRT